MREGQLENPLCPHRHGLANFSEARIASNECRLQRWWQILNRLGLTKIFWDVFPICWYTSESRLISKASRTPWQTCCGPCSQRKCFSTAPNRETNITLSDLKHKFCSVMEMILKTVAIKTVKSRCRKSAHFWLGKKDAGLDLLNSKNSIKWMSKRRLKPTRCVALHNKIFLKQGAIVCKKMETVKKKYFKVLEEYWCKRNWSWRLVSMGKVYERYPESVGRQFKKKYWSE